MQTNKAAATVPTNAASSGVAIDKKQLKALMRRSDRPGLVWLAKWLCLLAVSGVALSLSWGTIWVIPAMLVYGSVLTVSSYALSHECAHGTAFRTRRINELCFWISSFIYFEEPTHRRYAHASHHTYTWQNGLDGQMPYGTPMTFKGWLLEISGLGLFIYELSVFLKNAGGRFAAITLDYTPQSELPKLKWGARAFLVLYIALGVAIYMGADFLLWYLVLPRLAGGPVMLLYTLIQHVDMREDQPDLRESTRSFTTNAFSRFLYMNMNYHIEHHLFPTVPFYALPKLNEAIKDQLPEPDPGCVVTNWRVLKALIKRSMGKIPMENMGRAITLV